MKWLILYLLLAVGALGCQNDDLTPARKRQLYKTWIRTQSFRHGQGITFNQAYDLLVEFRPDGQLLYGTQKTEGGCCRPSRFNTEENFITFILNSTLNCAQVRCAAPELTVDVPWRIAVVTTNELILTNDNTTLVFKPIQ